jgi:hypothetical protein
MLLSDRDRQSTRKVPDKKASTGGTILPLSCFATRITLRWGPSMSELRAADDFSVSSVRGLGVGDLVTERAPDPVHRSRSETREVQQSLICARITEVRSDRQTNLDGDYYFEQLPAPNDQIVILNRWGSYDIMRVLHSAHAPETAVYVRWVARR